MTFNEAMYMLLFQENPAVWIPSKDWLIGKEVLVTYDPVYDEEFFIPLQSTVTLRKLTLSGEELDYAFDREDINAEDWEVRGPIDREEDLGETTADEPAVHPTEEKLQSL